MASKNNNQPSSKPSKSGGNSRHGSSSGAQNTGGRVRLNEGRKSGGKTTTGSTGPRKNP